MQLTRKERTLFDAKKVEQMLLMENRFISDLFSILSLPTRSLDNVDEEGQTDNNFPPKNVKNKETTRAKSLNELQERLQAIASKKTLTYKEKLTKKHLKNRMKKKTKQNERNAQQKLLRAQKSENGGANSNMKTPKPIFNSEGKMVFSKFDFSNLGTKQDKKQDKDPKKILENLEKQKERLEELQESGEISKVIEIKEKTAWKNALAKTSGKKVKDDVTLLKKTVHREEQRKRSSKKKWDARQEQVAKAKQDRQNKRTVNIDKRKKEKKKNKLKKSAKKGKIIPGF